MTLVLLRTPVQLETVKVTESQDLKHKSYHLDAEELAASTRAIFDASDVFKLRPDMMNSRGGAKACEVPYTDRTGWIESVWVNGRRVTLAMVDEQFAADQKRRLGISAPAPRPNPRLSPNPRRVGPPPQSPPPTHLDTVLSILHLIRPEHISEISYRDCFDASAGKNNSDLAMFITLKPGVGFDQGRGSYIVEEAVAAGRDTMTDRMTVGDLPRYRFRLLGLYDAGSGDPIAAAEVSDSTSGVRATTTATGTVSLFFVPEGLRTIRLHAAGFKDTTIAVTIAPTDTVPITMTLTRLKPPT